MRYSSIFMVINLIFIACSYNKAKKEVSTEIQRLIALENLSPNSSTFVVDHKPCAGCDQALKNIISEPGKDQYIILVNNRKNYNILLRNSIDSNTILLQKSEHPELTKALDGKIALWYSTEEKIQIIEESDFYSRTDQNKFSDSISLTLKFDLLFDFSVYHIEQVKWRDDKYFIQANFDQTEGDQVEGIIIVEEGVVTQTIDLYDLGKSRKYPLGIGDFEISGNHLYLISTMELIRYNLKTRKIDFRQILELPEKHLIDNNSYDFQLIDSLFLAPLTFGFAYYYEPRLYRETQIRYIIINNKGEVKHQFGKFPDAYHSGPLFISNPSVAASINGSIYYYFHNTKEWQTFSLRNHSKTHLPPPKYLRLTYCDSLNQWHREYDGYIPENLRAPCRNAYFKNLAFSDQSVIYEYFTVRNGQYLYHFDYRDQKSGSWSSLIDSGNAFWIENKENKWLFYNFRRAKNLVEFFEGQEL